MHIAIAAHDFYPDPGSGGTGRYVYETARRLVDRGNRVSVITRRRGDVPRRETVDGVGVYRYDISIAERSLPDIVSQLPGALRTVSEYVDAITAAGRPDVVSFQGPVTSFLVHLVVDDVPRICTFHSPWPTEYRIRTRGEGGRSGHLRRLNVRARKRLESALLARTDGAIALSEFMRERLRSAYGSVADATVIPGGVDVDRFSPEADPFEEIEAGGPSFLTVRRLSPRMGHELLLSAFASVTDHRPEAELYVAGDGPLRDALERTATRLGVADRTTFLGYVPDAALPGVYAAADVFVLPTTELEGFGLATLEALASGTPVVGTPVGATPEVLSDLAADPAVPERMLVPTTSADALARLMRAWIDLSADERAAAGRACRRYARERYTWEETTNALASYYADRIES